MLVKEEGRVYFCVEEELLLNELRTVNAENELYYFVAL